MRVVVVIVNWNGWEDTLECLESVLRTESHEVTVVVCDNGSSDGSVERIRDWADGRLDVRLPLDAPLRSLSFPPLPKPLEYVEYRREEAEAGGGPGCEARLVLVRTGGNLGFAGGTNVGLRYALAQPDCEAVWLLNNDTVVRPDALDWLVRQLRESPAVGMVGSTILHYDRPDLVQSAGGWTFNRWLAITAPLGAGRPFGTVQPANRPVGSFVYVSGASMLVSVEMLREIGLMNEEYFLYFEEVDWALRARERFALAHASKSAVYHREGQSIGGAMGRSKSWTADYYFMRGRLLITRRFAPYALPTLYVGLAVAMLRRAWRGEWDRVSMIARLWKAR